MNCDTYKSLRDVLRILFDRVAARFPMETGLGSSRGIQRFEIDCPPLSPLRWLSRQPGHARYYWTDRERRFEMAGIGECDVVMPSRQAGIQQVLNYVRSSIGGTVPWNGYENTLRYYGGFRFHFGTVPSETAMSDRWRDFKDYRFVLPLLELCRDGERYYFACNLKDGLDKETVMNTLRCVTFSESVADTAMPVFSDRSDLPDMTNWKSLVNAALDAINANTLQKAVLARQSTFRANGMIDAIALTRRLEACATNAYLFCFQPTSGRAFLGASPECLYKREGRRICSEALAGTRPRGDTHKQDDDYEKELLHCDKEQREHQLVVDDIRAVLGRFCTEVAAPASPTVMKLACCQHLHTPITGLLADDEDDTALLEALHPTPAVGGLPKDEAARWIHEHEPFERGIYAAPVGWIGADNAEFCVGIRSGLVRGETLILYSGAGIVAGARPEEEWRELEAKLATFLAAIGIN